MSKFLTVYSKKILKVMVLYLSHPDPFINPARAYHYTPNSYNFDYGRLKKIKSIFEILPKTKLETSCQNLSRLLPKKFPKLQCYISHSNPFLNSARTYLYTHNSYNFHYGTLKKSEVFSKYCQRRNRKPCVKISHGSC